MPDGGRQLLGVVRPVVLRLRIAVDEVELGIIFGLSRGWVDVESAKSAGIRQQASTVLVLGLFPVAECYSRSPCIQLPFRRLVEKVLVPEHDDTSLSDK